MTDEKEQRSIAFIKAMKNGEIEVKLTSNNENHERPKKYLKQYAALEEAAKTEIIEILSNNPTGRYIWFNCEIEEENDAYSDSVIMVMDGNEQIITDCCH